MRPKSIALFEQLYLIAILIEAVRIALEWQSLIQSAFADVLGRVAAVAISLLLVLLASRWRKRIAGLLLAALFAIGLPVVATVLRADQSMASASFMILQVALQLIAIVLLFTPASRNWFAGRDSA